MNKRLEELALECGAWHQVYEPKRFLHDHNFDIERFAELIVQECIDIIAPYSVRMIKPGEEYLHPIQEIKQHFGVEL